MAAEADLTALTAIIVASLAANNPVSPADLPGLILAVHAALREIGGSSALTDAGLQPAVPVEESITRDYLVCLEDGRRLKVLTRYLRCKYALSPDAYRARWHLPPDYPMAAPAYAELRSRIARHAGATPRASGRRPPSGG